MAETNIPLSEIFPKSGLDLSHRGTPLLPEFPEHYTNKQYVDAQNESSLLVGCLVSFIDDGMDIPRGTLIDPMAFVFGNSIVTEAFIIGEIPQIGDCILVRKLSTGSFEMNIGTKINGGYGAVYGVECTISLQAGNDFIFSDAAILTTQPVSLCYDESILSCTLTNFITEEDYAQYNAGALLLVIQKAEGYGTEGHTETTVDVQFRDYCVSLPVNLSI
jgi:hypothetical protein